MPRAPKSNQAHDLEEEADGSQSLLAEDQGLQPEDGALRSPARRLSAAQRGSASEAPDSRECAMTRLRFGVRRAALKGASQQTSLKGSLYVPGFATVSPDGCH